MNCVKTKVSSAITCHRHWPKIFISPIFAITLFLGIGMICLPGEVYAEQIHKGTHNNKDGSYNELWHSTDHDIYYIKEYDKDGNLKNIYVDVNPSPDDDTGTGGNPREAAKALMRMLKKMGGKVEYEPNFWSTPLGRALIKTGKGPQPGDPIDPPPEGGIWQDADGLGGSGSGGIDPSAGPIKEQLGKKKGKKGDDDDDGDDGNSGDSSPWGEEYAANPELVNPPPIYKTQVAKLNVQKLGQKLEFKGAKLVKTLKLTAGKSSEAIFQVINRGDAASKATTYSVECKGLGLAAGKCPAFKKRGSLTVIGAKRSKDIKIKLTPMVAGEYNLKLKLANGEAQTLKLKVAPAKLKRQPGVSGSTRKVQTKPRMQEPGVPKSK